MLKDTNTYVSVDKDPTLKIESDLRDILNRWVSKGFLESHTKMSLTSYDSLLPRAYEIPKIHKPYHPYRIIILTINSSFHHFALYLHKILYKSLPYSPFNVKNSFHLHNMLSGLRMHDDCILSFDVVSLFTNVPIETVLSSVSKRSNFIRLNIKINKYKFIFLRSQICFVLHVFHF